MTNLFDDIIYRYFAKLKERDLPPWGETMELLKADLIQRAFDIAGGKIQHAADLLAMNRSTLSMHPLRPHARNHRLKRMRGRQAYADRT
jgi:DNA-binding NtrC family response regulator